MPPSNALPLFVYSSMPVYNDTNVIKELETKNMSNANTVPLFTLTS